MAALELTLSVLKDQSNVSVLLPSLEQIAPSLREVFCRVDNSKRQSAQWEPGLTLSLQWQLKPGEHHLEIDFGGLLPSGVLTLPVQTKAITGVLPPLVRVEDGKPDHECRLWNPLTPPQQLSTVVPSLFALNPQLTSLPGTFANLPALKEVPESLFFPLIYVKHFENTFRMSGLAAVSPLLFNSNTAVESFFGVFSACKDLHQIPEDLFFSNTAVKRFDQAFADSGLKTIPAGLFQRARKNAYYLETFARTDIQEVPAGLFKDVEPRNIDGIFEPKGRCDHDPMNIKAGPRFSNDFFADTRSAAGIATRPKRT